MTEIIIYFAVEFVNFGHPITRPKQTKARAGERVRKGQRGDQAADGRALRDVLAAEIQLERGGEVPQDLGGLVAQAHRATTHFLLSGAHKVADSFFPNLSFMCL